MRSLFPGSRRTLPTACFLWSFCFVVSLSAWTPIYSPERVVRPGDVHPGLTGGMVSLSAVSATGHLAGQVTYQTKVRGVTQDHSEAFVLPANSQSLVNLNDLLPASSSTATCVSTGGLVAGVFWTGSVPERQLGFLYDPNGSTWEIQAPGDLDVVAVTVIDEGTGWVLGTYLDGNYRQRAFANDANGVSYDLGVPFDPQADFLWPQAITLENVPSANGPVATSVVWGTLYVPDGSDPLGNARLPQVFRSLYDLSAQGFQMAPLGGAQTDDGTSFVGADTLNSWAGQSLQASTTVQGSYDTGGFYSRAGQFTAVGAPQAGQRLQVLAISPVGVITGLTRTLNKPAPRLFSWSASTGLQDLGSPLVNGGDHDALLTGVSPQADRFVGTLRNGAGQRRVFVCTDGQTWDLTATVPGSFGFAVDQNAPNQASIFVDDARRVICAGRLQGTSAAVVFTQDLDGNGLPDGWETQFFGHTGVDPAGDEDGDGHTNLDEFRFGTDPRDFYDGQVPALAVVDGGDQRGHAGTVLPRAVVVGTGVGGKQNAPLHFAASGGALLSAQGGSGASWTATLDLQATNYVQGPGGSGWGAQVHVLLPAGGSGASVITASTSSSPQAAAGVHTRSVSTSVSVSDASLTPPTGLTLGTNSATTMEISWTPSDLSLGTVVEVSYDWGATWTTHSTLEPGVVAATLYRLVPDQHVQVRLYTAGPVPAGGGGGGGNNGTNTANNPSAAASGGGGSDSGNPGDRDTHSVPKIMADFSSVSVRNWSYGGFQPTSTQWNRYLRVDEELYRFTDFYPDGYLVDHCATEITQVVPWYMTMFSDYGPSYLGDDDDGVYRWSASSDTDGKSTNYGYRREWRYKLSEPFTLAKFEALAEAISWDFSGQFYPVDGALKAELHLEQERWYPLPLLISASHHYSKDKVHYRFHCNADPQGQVVYDIMFTPDDGSEVKHDIHVIPTNGQTEVGDPANNNEPFVLDPLTLNNKAKGKYEVVPIELQIDDWKHDGDQSGSEGQASTNTVGGQPNEPVVDTSFQQLGLIGDMVKSNKVGQVANPERHFVTPKRNNSTPELDRPSVRLRAQLPSGMSQDIVDYEWTLQKDNGPVQVVAVGEIYDLSREVPGKYKVSLRTIKDKKDAGSINVWVVWADGEFTHIPDNVDTNMQPTRIKGFDGTIRDGLVFIGANAPFDASSGFVAHFTIQPASITDRAQDIPNLMGESDSAYPPSPYGRSWPMTRAHRREYDNSLGAKYKWDASQSLRCHISNSKPIPKTYLSDYDTPTIQTLDLYANQPKADDLVRDFPISDVEGNDDIPESAQQNDPYQQYTDEFNPGLEHGVGVLAWADAPRIETPGNPATDGDPSNTWEGAIYEQEYDLAAFTRLQIGKVWYRVSKHLNWHVTLHVSCHNGKWQDYNHYSQSGTSPASD